MRQVNPQAIIDELSKRVQQLTLENIVLTAQLAELSQEDEITIIGDSADEE